MKKRQLLTAALLCTAFLAGGTTALAAENSTIHTGVYADGIDLSGMTREEALETLNGYVGEMGAETLTLQIGDKELTPTLKELGLVSTNEEEIVEEAAELGKSGNMIRRYKERKDLEHENKNYQLTWALDQDLVTDYVNNKCKKFDQEAVDATLKREGGSFQVVDGQTGIVLDADTSITMIMDFIEKEWDHTNGSLTLPVETDYPRGTKEELSKVKDVLGTFTTSYSTSGAARCQNIASGAKHINGTVLYPGDTFSAYETVSPFSEANGYAMAGSYLNGKVVDSLGGGICQVSTTLYNAVLRAELEVVERSNHSMIVNYVEPADDAAIAGTYKDLKFKNNLDAPVYIEGVTSGKQITFTIYGQETRPANRTLKFESVTLSTTEPGVQIVADAGQPIGYITRESAHRGVVAELYKHVYVNGKEESKTKVNKSNYKATPRTITVGIAGDPELSNELQAAIATQDEATVNVTLASCVARMQQ
ncbi:VanW family protein [Candidatus Merdisoma sp. HCP28S3_D10]|uniref:VanW family protein n=1 Tax=unclassified Candidatus Merdisoma TaxID=3099611 RepID=UPI003F891B74